MENLQNIDEEYCKHSNKKDSGKKASWDNESFTTVELYKAEHFAQKGIEEPAQQKPKAKPTDEERSTSDDKTKEDDKKTDK